MHALRGADLTARRGEIYGLLGPNGAGKTTLVKVLLGIVRPTSGAARLLGEAAGTPRSRRRVGYLPEDHRLPEYQTAAGLLDLAGGLSGMPRRARKRRTPELLDLVGLGDVGGKRIRGYSKGMKQRLGLAQALIHEPEILFLDEPTDGVDAVGRTEIRDTMLRLRDEGVTIMLNSHLLGDVERVCDRAGIMVAGQIDREGTIAELTETELVYRVALDRPLLPALAENLPPTVLDAEHAAFEVALQRDEQIDEIVDRLRATGHGIRGLSRQRKSLEDVFIEQVNAQREEVAQ